jgi:alpha/beta superfamily hydrolase
MYIKGPKGEIEAQWDATADATDTAILCHPHPLFGGSMDDGILQLVSETLSQLGFDCLRFNFRGVGNSSGEHDGGAGEIDDLVAVSTWLENEKPGRKPWLIGYSFGAHVVWQSLGKFSEQQIAGVILVAPPVGRMSFSQQDVLPCSVFAIAGDRDDFVDEQAFRRWSGIDARVIEGADHFFSVTSAELTLALRDILG